MPSALSVAADSSRGLQGASGYHDRHALLAQLTSRFKTDSPIGARDERDLLVRWHA